MLADPARYAMRSGAQPNAREPCADDVAVGAPVGGDAADGGASDFMSALGDQVRAQSTA
jgi:hypothetical protein